MRATDDPNYHNEWYHRNKARLAPERRERNRRDYAAKRNLINYLKIERGECDQCGLICTEANVVAFDWDHIDRASKSFDLGSAPRNKRTADILAEIEKCRLLCKICHALHTHSERHWQRPEHPSTDQLTLFEEPK